MNPLHEVQLKDVFINKQRGRKTSLKLGSYGFQVLNSLYSYIIVIWYIYTNECDLSISRNSNADEPGTHTHTQTLLIQIVRRIAFSTYLTRYPCHLAACLGDLQCQPVPNSSAFWFLNISQYIKQLLYKLFCSFSITPFGLRSILIQCIRS